MGEIDRDHTKSDVPVPPAAINRPIPGSILAGCVLAWLGALTSILLLQGHVRLRHFFCPVLENCERVLRSKYGAFAGIPLSVLGVGFYLVVLGLLLMVCGMRSKAVRARLLNAALWIAVAGATFSAGLMYLQFASLRAFCPLCTVSALIVGGLVWAMSKAAHFTAAEDWTASQSTALTLAAFAVFPVSILLISGLTSQSSSGPRRLQIDLSEAHLSGPADARVKLVVFSDFQCPFCRDLAPILNQVRNQFPHEVALGFHHFPIESHRRAFPAALAAECAAEQGKFWEYHDKLFAEGGDLSDSKLLALADSLSLDQKRFAECLKSEKPKQRVEASRRDAANSGLEGVPAVFLNGLRVEGPLDYENLVRKINELLLAMPPIRAGENSP